MVENLQKEFICTFHLTKDYINTSWKSVKAIELGKTLLKRSKGACNEFMVAHENSS